MCLGLIGATGKRGPAGGPPGATGARGPQGPGGGPQGPTGMPRNYIFIIVSKYHAACSVLCVYKIVLGLLLLKCWHSGIDLTRLPRQRP